jgi:predicted MFS family arabinose efflux permease
MAAMLAAILAGVLLALPPLMGKAKASRSARELFAKNRGVNLLAAARIALFGARDVWFVVGLPVFLYAAGWSFAMVGGFLALWTIGYGVVQAAAPALVRRSADGLSAEVPAARLWSLLLAMVPAALAVSLAIGIPRPDLVVTVGLAVFGFAFAVNSSVHSYLILAYAGSEKAAEDVGFYYAANAAGRFAGTLLSGMLYAAGGIGACLAGSAAMLAACWAVTLALPVRVEFASTS